MIADSRMPGGGPRLPGGRVATACLLAALLSAPVVRADGDDADWMNAAVEYGNQFADSIDTAAIPEQLRQLSQVDWSSFWTRIQDSLASGSLDDLAELDPYARQALEWLDAAPQMAPTADWLRQRLDYFDAAATLESAPAPRRTPAVAPPGPAAAPPKPKGPVAWPKAPPAHHVSAGARAPAPLPVTAEKVGFWKRLLGRRPVPTRRVEVPRLKSIFRSEGVPEDLVWMAETESTMNPAARSPAGAVGLFQFTPDTAGRFGLKLKPQDERLEPEKSARAAACYLRYLNGQFRDWPLAIAAFNAGEGRVSKAMQRSGGKTFEAIAPQLPTETRMYVPKVLATIALREGHEFDGT